MLRTTHELALVRPVNVIQHMDDKPRTEADQDDDETADSTEESGPLGRFIERETGSGTVESEGSTGISNGPKQPNTASTDYAAGTTEHDDDREP